MHLRSSDRTTRADKKKQSGHHIKVGIAKFHFWHTTVVQGLITLSIKSSMLRS